MCRITGVFQANFKGQFNLQETGNRMRDTMIAGGPDSAGDFVSNENGLYLGHRRLSIIDLSAAGHQPMQVGDDYVVFNGEIYNYQEIRSELEAEGVTFHSNSDTEVVLKSFLKWGKDCVQKFHGMWSFAIWQAKEQKLTLCRDRMGVKPLYFYKKGDTFLFSSELKAFHQFPDFDKTIDESALSLFLQRGYIIAPKSIFKYCQKVKPGTFLEISKDLELKETKYWDVKKVFDEDRFTGSEEELTEALEEELFKAFNHRMVADVPVGVFLSGGVDSSTVAAILQKRQNQQLKTFTIGFEDKKFNEAEYAKEIAQHLGTEHHEYYCTTKDAQEIIPQLPELYDEPFGDSSAIPTHLVAKFANEHVKVALSADGGDEQFLGYNRYKVFPSLLGGKYKALGAVMPLASSLISTTIGSSAKGKNFLSKTRKLQYVQGTDLPIDGYDRFMVEFFPNEQKLLGVREFEWQDKYLAKSPNLPLQDQMMLYDQQSYMIDDILTKVDRATMGTSLEGREPFLDHKLIEFTSRIPHQLKYKNGTDKYLLRKVLYKYVPQEMIERPKMGFGIPLKEWFQTDLKSFYLEVMDEKALKNDPLLNSSYIGQLTRQFMSDQLDKYDYKMWFLFVYLQWKKHWNID